MEPVEWLGGDKAERFPLHMVSNQPRARLHSQLDCGSVSRAAKVAGREAMRMNPDDAAARGIADGDVARVFNDRGACLAGVVVSDAIRRGVIELATGAWFDPVDPATPGSLEKHGNPNVLTIDKPTSDAHPVLRGPDGAGGGGAVRGDPSRNHRVPAAGLRRRVKVLLVFAHPGADSLNAAIRDRAVAALEKAGHRVDLCDLYAEGFDPVLTAEERAAYFDTEANRARNAGYVERLFAAEGLVFVFPTWTLGPPAILKGFFDRVMVPGVSFRVDEKGRLHPNLRHIRALAAIVTYGRGRPILLVVRRSRRARCSPATCRGSSPGARGCAISGSTTCTSLRRRGSSGS